MTLRWDDWSRPEYPHGRWDDATEADRYETTPSLTRRPPVRVMGDPSDDASMPIPFRGAA